MESIFMLVFLTSIIIIQFYTITILPVKGNKQLLLGCVVTEEIRNNSETKELISRFKRINLVIMIISEVILILGCLRNSEIIMVIAIFFSIIASSISFGINNTNMRKIKSIMGGLKGKKQVTIFEIEKVKFNKRNLIIEIISSLVFIGVNIYFAVTRYDLLPNEIAINFDIMGNVTNYSEKSIGVFLSLIISIIIVAAIFLFVEYLIRNTKLRIDPRNVEKSRQGNIKYRNLLSNTMVWTYISTLVLLTIVNLVLLQVVNMNIAIVWINIICAMLLVVVLVVFIIKANKLRFDYKIENNTVVQRDDDDKWIWGLIYYNKEDPRINVEKRFGIGYTVNAGTPAGMTIYIGTVILLVVVLISASF
ncbi:DUF5808 domain-containing protein [Clostridium sp. D53t1_180928_C8]|uniref:DUF5808 domain-containing protein n=1 Tax=Clostridium sp. D53t1_180928_C8 TaxID=2787101 RepID=UPI0018A9199D|nr:DUF5808 domain-containing protein [Clostridium sp. D53t1_180928_C8]